MGKRRRTRNATHIVGAQLASARSALAAVDDDLTLLDADLALYAEPFGEAVATAGARLAAADHRFDVVANRAQQVVLLES